MEGEVLGENFVARVSDFVVAHSSTCFTFPHLHLRSCCLQKVSAPDERSALGRKVHNRNPFQIVFERAALRMQNEL